MAEAVTEEFTPRRKTVVTASATPRKTNRRNFLKTAGLISGALGVAGMARGAIAFKDDTERGVTALKAKAGLVEGDEKVQSGVGLKEEVVRVSSHTDFDLIFGNLSKEGQNTARLRVDQSRANLEENMTIAQLRHLAKFDELVRLSAADKIPSNLLFGLIIAESKGDERIISGVRAKGLTQMMVPIAEKYGLVVNDDFTESSPEDSDERYIPDRILPATATELAEVYSRYGNWGFAIWEWHLGTGNLHEALSTYFTSKGQTMPEQNYRQFFKEAKVTVYDVLTNSSVANMFAQGDFDRTQDYVYNVLAGSEIYREFEKSLNSKLV